MPALIDAFRLRLDALTNAEPGEAGRSTLPRRLPLRQTIPSVPGWNFRAVGPASGTLLHETMETSSRHIRTADFMADDPTCGSLSPH
jgi:hypothetical protein